MTSDTAATPNTNEMTKCCSSTDCGYIAELKAFIRDVTKDAVTNGGGGVENGGTGNAASGVTGNGIGELRTRNNAETYPVNEAEELQAEVCIHVWQKLASCPEHFRLGLHQLIKNEILSELNNVKVREDLIEPNKQQQQNNTELDAGQIKCFDLLKLQKFISQQLDRILLRLSDNSKEDDLKTCGECQCSKRDAGTVQLPPCSVMQIKNKPRKMEDRHVCLPRFGELYGLEAQHSFFGVFDGHSGALAATYAANQMPYLVSKYLKEMKITACQTETDFYRDVLEASFLKADSNFAQKSLGSGTTAVCALLKYTNNSNVTANHLYVAWVGDSRCLLVSPTVSLQLVKPHKPDSMDERKRIESIETGGAVVFVHGQWRVNGIINVSRSIGDHSVKAVIAEPDFVDVPLQSSHDFLILGSDGLWDHVTEADIVKCTYKSLADVQQPLEDIPKQLIELAKKGDSQDNITVMLVLLKERSNIIENYTKNFVDKTT
ncbi:protein phosphatase 1F [Musca vetustissima]|uniref:protein phosphatase 1F n=1 Tax=Musca vetustissima TaxID=27455 RepID=UPI002AB69CD6|nr:protein phosphatase 1F [Musca vetustissima]